jgi:hypothetical protein
MVELRGMIRRMVLIKKKKMMRRIKTTKQTMMEIEQTVMEMMMNLGKTVELMGVVRRIVVMKKKQMMSWIKKTKQTVKEMMDAVMEIMAVMIIMMKNQQKKVDMRRNQDLLLTILLNEKKNLTRVYKTASHRFSEHDTSKTNKNQNKEEKKDNCLIQRVRCVYQLCQIIPKNTELPNIGTKIVF